MTAKTILKVVPGLQATSVAMFAMPKFDKKGNIKPEKPLKLFKKSVGIFAGVAMIKPTSQMINDLP